MSSSPPIEVVGLEKSFGRFEALNGLDLTVKAGEVHAFLGPNGAGKSTTIRILLGLLRSNGGSAKLFGENPWRDVVSLHKRLAYVPGDVSLWPNMTGGQAIDMLGALRGGVDPVVRGELIERFELDPSKRGRQYSKGNRQKVAIIAALAANTELLLLDEPTSGLDPLMENVFQDVVKRKNADGVTVLLSSHVLAEVETLADRLTIIRDGKTVATGTLEELRDQASVTIRATLRTMPNRAQISNLENVALDGNRLTATVQRSNIDAAMKGLTGCGVESLTVEPPSLESLFLRIYDQKSAS